MADPHEVLDHLLLHPPRGSITAETVKAAQIAWRGGWFIAWAEEFCGGDRRARPMWWMADYETQRRPKPRAEIEEEQSPPMIGCASPGCSARASVMCAETRAPTASDIAGMLEVVLLPKRFELPASACKPTSCGYHAPCGMRASRTWYGGRTHS